MVVRDCLSVLPQQPERAASALSRVAASDWPGLLDAAAAHGALALLESAVAASTIPADALADFQRRLLVQRMWTEQTVASIERLAALFGAAGIPVLALKGPVFAERYHHTVSDRPSIDVDLLLRPDALPAALRLLREAGYTSDAEIEAAYLLAHSHHLHFDRAGEPQLELHFRAYHGFGVSMPASALMDRAEPYVFNGRTPTLVASPEDEVLYLCAHAAGHSFVRLLWLYDLKLVLLKRSVDWRLVRERSEAMGLAGAVAYAATLLERWLSVVGIPPLIKRRPSGARGWMADRLLPVAAVPSRRSSTDNLGGLLFTAMLADRASAAGRLVGHHVLRGARRRIHRAAPRLAPASWSA